MLAVSRGGSESLATFVIPPLPLPPPSPHIHACLTTTRR